MHARPFIDSLDFARNGQEIDGEVPIAELSRLQDVLENQRGVLSYTVQGVMDEQGTSGAGCQYSRKLPVALPAMSECYGLCDAD